MSLHAEGVVPIDGVRKEIAWCVMFDQADKCCGASGRKLRQVCIWCPRYWKYHGITHREGTINMGENSSIEKLNDAIEEIRKDISSMAKSIAVMEVKLEAVSKDVDEMKQTPRKRWDTVISVIITAAVTAFITYIIGKTRGEIM